MKVLVFNCGSSSLKYRLIDLPTEVELAGGEAQRIGPPTAKPARIVHRADGQEQTIITPMRDHSEAFQKVMELLGQDSRLRPDAVGHRLVHGGQTFAEHAVMNEANVRDLEALNDLAPLHNPPAVELVKACLRLYPSLPQVAVFDTAYHRTIPPRARTYALPGWMRDELGFRKYGFHGTSHHFVATQAATFLGKPLDQLNAVSCHLGSGGASLCAIASGHSVDNTMGYSPLQGLLMSTRCGDLDPAVALRLLWQNRGDCQSVEKALNRHSGVLGMSGASGDIRDVLARAGGEGPAADRNQLTSQFYLWRIRKYLGAYLTVVGRAEAIIFTDTIGETVPSVRWAVCADMECFGLRLDPRKNDAATALPADVAAADSPVRILVIQTNEELAIARNTYRLLERATSQPQNP
jgi:acetate kinase